MKIFLDYYHPYAGLCNQLYLITNHIHSAILKGLKIYINKVNIDIFKKERIPAEDFFDLNATNENIKKIIGWEPILYKKPTKNFTIPKLCIYPVSSIEILNCLEFNKGVLNEINTLKIELGGDYNAIHFRLEMDPIIHYLYSQKTYNKFMEISTPELCENLIKLPEIQNYINFILNQYLTFIGKIGFSKKWYICTCIGKNKIHNPLIQYLNILLQFIENSGGSWFIGKQIYTQRELNALIDLLILRDSHSMVGFEGSSFSEGYCYKVNLIRNPGKTYYFVNGIVPKILSCPLITV
jgi:hypothetical protein